MLLRKAILCVALVSAGALLVFGCAQQPIAGGQPASAKPAAGVQTASAAAPQPAKPANPYEAEVKPLTTRECAACHLGVFNTIRNSKQKHQLECTFCHESYHTYKPGKTKWAEIMPDCQKCHGKAHGDKMANCLDCHVQAHAPLNIAATDQLQKGCAACHEKVATAVKAKPSAHTNLGCNACHSNKHGYIPACAECHEPHVAQQPNEACLACHPVHTPLAITYPVTEPNTTCAACHAKAQQQLTASATKHSALTCAKCHPVHKKVMACSECHGQPHAAAMLKQFKTCGDCHGKAHNMPRMGAPK
jgi:hypothetical protein